MKNASPILNLLTAGLALFLIGAERPLHGQTASVTVSTNSVAAEAPGPPTPDAVPAPEWDRNMSRQHAPVVFADYVLEKGRTNSEDAVVVKGTATINGQVEGNAVAVMGDARVNGTVRRDLVVVLGSAELGSEAVVEGDVVVVGGKLRRANGSKIQGDIVEIDPAKVPGLAGAIPWITRGLLLGRPLPFVAWAWLVAGVFLLINLLLQLLFPRPIQAAVDTMEKQPISSFFTGILVKLLTGLLCVLLAVSVVGIIAIPFLVAALVVSFLFGKITIYRYAGQQLGRQLGLTVLESPARALIAGTGVFYLLYAVPFLGFIAWGFTGLFGLGAVVLTGFQQFRREKATTRPFPAAPSPTMPFSEMRTDENPAAAQPDPFVPPPFAPAPAPEPASVLENALLPRAGFWIRLFALGLDVVLFIIPTVMIARHLGSPELLMLLWLAYHVVLWATKGTTIGGIIMGIKVIRLDGRSPDFTVALVRALASILSAAVLGLGFFWAGIGREKQSWHDKVAGTVMVKVPKGMSLV